MHNLTRKAQVSSNRLSGAVRPKTLDIEARTVEVVFTTGESGKRYDYRSGEYYLEELEVSKRAVRTERLDKGLSVIDNHNTHEGINGVFGVTEDYRFENGKLIGTVRFATDPDSDVKFTKVADGILRHVSVGYTIHKYLKSKGESDEFPTYRAVDWTINELSFTPVSFETTNGVRAEQRDLNDVEIEDYVMTQEQLRRLTALLSRSADLNAEEKRELADLQAEVNRTAEPSVVVTPTVRAAEGSGEGLTAEAITAAVRAGLNPEPVKPVSAEPTVEEVRTQERQNLQIMLDAAKVSGFESDFANRSFNEGKTVEQFRELLFAEMGKEDSEHTIKNVGMDLVGDERNDAAALKREAATISLLQRCGMETDSKVDTSQFIGLSTYDMGREFAIATGQNVIGMSRPAVASRAFHSTSDFPLLLENVMNKSLMNGYIQVPQTFRDLGDRVTVNDFREKHMYNVGDSPNLLPLKETGEYEGGSISESKEKFRISTFARKIGFTREMLINDDLSAFTVVAPGFGQSASNLESDIVWGLILNWDFFKNIPAVRLMSDGKPLFDIDHGNLLEGAASAFGVNSLSQMRLMGRKHKTLGGGFMNMAFQDLVIPEELETTVEQTIAQNFTAISLETTNPFNQNKFTSRIEPRLSVVSQKAWLAFSRFRKAFEYAFLAGQESLYLETNIHTDTDGMDIKARHDFGAGLKDYKPVFRAKGEV